MTLEPGCGVDLRLIARVDRIRIKRLQKLQKTVGKPFGVENFVAYRTGKREVLADDWVLELRPKHTRRIEQLKALADRKPLVAAGNAGLILHRRLTGAAALAQTVDQRRLADIRHTDNHDADRSSGHALALPRGNLFAQDVFDLGHQAVQPFARFAVDRDCNRFMLLEIFDPLGGLRRIRHIGLIHQNNFRLAADDIFQNRVPAAHRDAGVDQLRHDVNQL